MIIMYHIMAYLKDCKGLIHERLSNKAENLPRDYSVHSRHYPLHAKKYR